jgi:hypothetical protein
MKGNIKMAFDRSSLLAAMKLKTEVVVVEGGEVIVSEIGAADYIKLWSDPKNQKDTGEKVIKDGVEEAVMVIDMTKFTPALVAYSVVDEAGERLFTDEDVTLLARSSQAIFLKLAAVARKINGLSGEEIKN